MRKANYMYITRASTRLYERLIYDIHSDPLNLDVSAGIWEGIYAWVAANYATGQLGQNPKNTTGILELGGASTQVHPPPGSVWGHR